MSSAESRSVPPLLPVRPPETVSMRARDGARLEADVYRPDGGTAWPVLLMRVAGGRRTVPATHYAHPSWYAGHGYVVVIQDVRGTGASNGRFRPFAAEAEDGADAVAWAASLPGADGTVGLFGSGYAGYAQVLAAAAAPPALRAVAPAFAGRDAFADWAFEGGAFRQADVMRFALRMGAHAAQRVEDGTAHRALAAAAAALPVDDELPARPRVLREYARYTHYDDWLTSPFPGDFWRGLAAVPIPADVAVLRIAGWYDGRMAGDVAAFRAGDSRRSCLVVGPWSGEGWGRRCGAWDFGPAAAPDMDALHLDFFDRALKREAGGPPPPRVRLFDTLAAGWRDFDGWPQPEPCVLYLRSRGRAATRPGDGGLDPVPPGSPAVDTVVHDPAWPAPSLGTHGTADAGPADRACLDERTDVAVFETPPLTAAWRLAGSVDLDLWIEADAASFDVAAALSAVLPDGRAVTLTQGHARVEPGADARPLRMCLRAICATLSPGMVARLSLAGAGHPPIRSIPAPVPSRRRPGVSTLNRSHCGSTAARAGCPCSGCPWRAKTGPAAARGRRRTGPVTRRQ